MIRFTSHNKAIISMGVNTPVVATMENILQSDKDLFFDAGVDEF